MICSNCKKENKNSNIKCVHCSSQLIDINDFKEERKKAEEQSKKVYKILSNTTLYRITGTILFMIIMCFIYIIIDVVGYCRFINYPKTTAILQDYTDCIYSETDKTCKAIYEYKIDDTTYINTTKTRKSIEDYKIVETIYFDQKNPQKSLVHSWDDVKEQMLIIIILITIIIILWKIEKKLKNSL